MNADSTTSSGLRRPAAVVADRYTLERELGAGGMATVYLADDPKHHRKVAVKVLRPDLAAWLGPDRFPREVAIAANLQHPHILPVYDSGDVEGFLYYVMPYVEGESLRDRLAKHGELPLTEELTRPKERPSEGRFNAKALVRHSHVSTNSSGLR